MFARVNQIFSKLKFLSGTPRENRAKKNWWSDFYFFFRFYESSGRKKLITTGKKNKIFYPYRYGQKP